MKKIINKLIKKSPWYINGELKDCQKFWDGVPENLDIVNFGSNSAKYAITYKGSDFNGFNFAMGPQCLLMDLNLLKFYKHNLKRGAIVLIPICPFSSMAGYNYEIDKKYHTFLAPEYIPNYSKKEARRLTMLKENPFMYYPAFRLIIDTYSFIKQIFIRKQTPIDFESDSKRWLDCWKEEFSIKDLDLPLSDTNLKNRYDSAMILSEIINTCYREGFKPVVIIPPVHAALASKMSKTMLDTYINEYLKLANVESSIIYNDLFLDTISNNDSYYRNAYFMSEEGARVYSKLLFEKVTDHFHYSIAN